MSLEPGQQLLHYRLIRKIGEGGPVEAVIHLAAYYDFTGDDHPEYRRTNVDGLRYVLDACRPLGPRLFVFTSSVAASSFPPPGESLDEASPPIRAGSIPRLPALALNQRTP